ncbi:MAG: HAD-IA family hydrolase [Deltaproteobacteria bacterium]
MQNIKAVVFDFDGTLTPLTLNFDSLRAEIVKIAREYVNEKILDDMQGQYIIEMIYGIAQRLDGQNGPSEFKNRAFERLRVLEVEAARGKDVFPYTRNVMRSLHNKSIKTGIITRSCIDALKTVFPDIFDYTDSIVTREGIEHVKPHPDHVLEVLRILNVDPDETLIVGDHPTDVMAGRSAGTYTAGVLTGRTTREAFEEAGATYILNDIREIIQLRI